MPAKILICDNEEPLRALVRASLAAGDYDLVEARDGDEALALARETHPDLLVLDMMMPGRTGLEVLQEVRRDPALARARVLILTARAQAEDRDAAAAEGADAYVSKPFSPLELAHVVDELLQHSR